MPEKIKHLFNRENSNTTKEKVSKPVKLESALKKVPEFREFVGQSQ